MNRSNRNAPKFQSAMEGLETRSLMSASYSAVDFGAGSYSSALNDDGSFGGRNPGAVLYARTSKGKYGATSLVPLGTTAEHTYVTGINNNNWITGGILYDKDPESFHGAVWVPGKKGRFTPIEIAPLFGSGYSWAADVNDLNQITGDSYPTLGGDEFTNHAIVSSIRKGRVSTVDLNTYNHIAGFELDRGMAINNNSLIVGEGAMASNPDNTAAFYAKLKKGGGSVGKLANLTGISGTATAADVNDAGVIVGSSEGIAGRDHGVRWVWNKSDFAIQDLGVLAGKESGAMAINEKGAIVGYSTFTASNSDTHAVLWLPGKNGKMQMVDLNTLYNSHKESMTFTSANDINENGQISVYALDLQGKSHLVLLNPANATPAAVIAPPAVFSTHKIAEDSVLS